MKDLKFLHNYSHGTLIDLNTDNLVEAQYHFNPSLAFKDNNILMIYRYLTLDSQLQGKRRLALCNIGEDLQPLQAGSVDLAQYLSIEPNKLGKQFHADPRFFHNGDDLYFSFHDNFRLYICSVKTGGQIEKLNPKLAVLENAPSRRSERNWGFFRSDVLKAVYSLHPFQIMKFKEYENEIRGQLIWSLNYNYEWVIQGLGEPHGGTMPILIGDQYYAFFQSAETVGPQKTRNYHVGFYSFMRDEPHKLTRISRKPIISAEKFPNETSFFRNWRVVYPSGALFHEGKWLVSIGIHDKRMAMLIFDHDILLDTCEIFSDQGHWNLKGTV